MLMKENLGPLEEKYRRHYLSTDARHSIYGLLFLLVPTFSFMFTDFQFHRNSVSFWPVILIRLVFFVFAAAMVLILTKVKKPKHLDRINLVVTLGVIASVAAINLLRPEMFLTHITVDSLVILCCYLVFPNKMRARVFSAATYTLFLIATMTFWQNDVPEKSLNAIFLALFLANLMGLFISNQYHYFRRNRFQTCEFLLAAQSELKALANTDPLTGTPNRRRFFELGDIELKRFKRYQRNVSILIIDLDHFKTINDSHGHDAGDAVLVEFSSAVKKCLRSADILGRIGGEEFGILLPETTLEEALVIASRVNHLIREMRVKTNSGTVGISISVGVAQAEQRDRDLEGLIKRADTALYQAKNMGRDQVCVA